MKLYTSVAATALTLFATTAMAGTTVAGSTEVSVETESYVVAEAGKSNESKGADNKSDDNKSDKAEDKGNKDKGNSSAKSETNASAKADKDTGIYKNYGQLISSLRAGKTDVKAWTSDIAGLDADPEVTILTLADISNADTPALDNALEEYRADLQSAQNAITGNEDLMAALEADGYAAEDVIAIEMEGENKIVLIVDAQ